MTFENDPNRNVDPPPAGRSRYNYRTGEGFGWLPAILAVAAVVLLLMLLLPGRDTTDQVTQNTTATEQAPPATTATPPAPANPPANKPAPATPQQ